MSDWDIFGSLVGGGSADWGDVFGGGLSSIGDSSTDWLTSSIGSAADVGSGFDWSSLFSSGGMGTGLAKGLAVGGANLLGNYLGSNSRAKQSENLADAQARQAQQAADNYKKWLQLLKPTESQKEGYRAAGGKRTWQDYDSTNRAITNNLASRNLGGGQLATGLADNKRAVFSKLGDLETAVEQYGVGSTPSSPAPTTATPTSLGTSDYFTSNLGNTLQYGSGLGLSSLLGNSGKSSDQALSDWTKSYFGW